MANYAPLFRLLRLFSSIQTLFLASSSTARRQYPDRRRLPGRVIKPVCVAVQRLHTFDIPFSIIQALLTTLSATNALQTFWYDDNVLDWTGGRRAEVDKFGKMMTSLPSHQHLRCLILGPLPIFGNPDEMGRSLARLQLASVRGLQTFHLRGRFLEPHIANVFAALPDTVCEARFVAVGISYFRLTHGGKEPRNKFREFAQTFSPVLRGRTRMTFVLDLGVAKRKLPEEQFGVIKDRAEKGLLFLKQQGRLLIDDYPKE
ncbi:hypothetical protein LXA43DRAFT_1068227 [Ganoderma leucocontextum]|nr:hypothetical protein LXA43DRAFT_1068227 [Ganoderma leucocontextum]